jgi:hypothetical protein
VRYIDIAKALRKVFPPWGAIVERGAGLLMKKTVYEDLLKDDSRFALVGITIAP